jgi:hypothetical protein
MTNPISIMEDLSISNLVPDNNTSIIPDFIVREDSPAVVLPKNSKSVILLLLLQNEAQ